MRLLREMPRETYVEAVFAEREAAEAARKAQIQAAIVQGRAVYWNPETEEEDVDWDEDWNVEEWEVTP